MGIRWLALALLGALLLGRGDLAADDKRDDASAPSRRESLTRLQSYVGQWRGVGQVRRGSREGAWIESASGAWNLASEKESLEIKSPKAKFFQSMRFEPFGEDGYRMSGAGPQGKSTYEGRLDEQGVLTLLVKEPAEGKPDRVQIRLAAEGKRLVILYERKASPSRFTRMAEIGFTRKGSGFGSAGGFVECVVTGGKGTIPVTFEGKTYYVCCSGCKEYFDDDPAQALAEYRERKAEEKARKKP